MHSTAGAVERVKVKYLGAGTLVPFDGTKVPALSR